MQEPFHLNLAANWIYLNDEFTSLDRYHCSHSDPYGSGGIAVIRVSGKEALLSLIRFFAAAIRFENVHHIQFISLNRE